MRQTDSLFYQVLATLQEHKVLGEFILVGSWCQYFYQEYFGHSPHIPMIRTLDLDLMIPNPPKIQDDIDVPKLLEN